MRPASLRAIGFAVVVSALIAAASTSAHADKRGSKEDADTNTGTSQSGSNVDVWRAQTRTAFFSQGSSCPWRYVGQIYSPATPDARLDDFTDSAGNNVLLFVDCNNIPKWVLAARPADVAQFLYERVRGTITPPTIDLEPRFNNAAVVNVDTWYWIDTTNQQTTFTGTLVNTTATITITPNTITTNWADGTDPTTCQAPGITYDSVEHPTDLATPDPAPIGGCSYRYRRHSGDQPDKRYPVTHTIEWNATWQTNDGQSGTFQPITNQTTTPLRVIQYQAIGTTNP